MIRLTGFVYGPAQIETETGCLPASELWNEIESLVQGHVAVTFSGIHNGHSALFMADFSNHAGPLPEILSEVKDLLNRYADYISYYIEFNDDETGRSLRLKSNCMQGDLDG